MVSRRNYLSATRLFYDNAAGVLREVCKRERDNFGLPLPTRTSLREEKDQKELDQIDFSALADHLNNLKRITSNHCGSFFKHAFECDTDFSTDPASKRKVAVLKPRNADPNTALVAGDKVVCIHPQSKTSHKRLKWLCIDRIEDSCYYLDHHERIVLPVVSVYHPTDAWIAVNTLRTLRNRVVGHPSSTQLSCSALDKLFADVEDAYKKLEVSEDVYKNEFDKIRAGKLIS